MGKTGYTVRHRPDSLSIQLSLKVGASTVKTLAMRWAYMTTLWISLGILATICIEQLASWWTREYMLSIGHKRKLFSTCWREMHKPKGKYEGRSAAISHGLVKLQHTRLDN